MLADPVTGIAGSFVKLSDDAGSGSIYTCPSACGVPIRVTVKQTLVPVGKVGVSRHLVSVAYPYFFNDGTSDIFAGTFATVNLTLIETNTQPESSGSMNLALLELLKFVSNGTTVSAFGTAVEGGAN